MVTTVRQRGIPSRTLVRAGLGGGYALIAVARCLQLWEVNRLNPAAPRSAVEAEIVAYVCVAVGVVSFVGGLDVSRIATSAAPAFRLLAVAGALLAVSDFAVVADEARHSAPAVFLTVTVIAAMGDAAIGYGWWVWSRARSQPGKRRKTASSQDSWPTPRRVTQVALASAFALYALSDVLVTIATHGQAGATRITELLIRMVGNGIDAVGHWQLVALLAWIAVAQAARRGLLLLGIGGCLLAVAPYLTGTMPPAAVNIAALGSLALGVGWLVWSAARDAIKLQA